MDYRKLFSILIFIVILTIVIFKGEELYNTLINIKSGWALAGLFFYCCNYLFRSLRIRTISCHGVRLWPEAVRTSTLHGFISYMMPVRAGDLSMPVLLKAESGIKIAEGTKILIRARLLDVFALGVFSLFASTIGTKNIPDKVRVIWILLSVLMIISYWLIKIASKSIKSLPSVLLSKLSSITNVPSPKPIEILQSLCIWSMVGSCFYCTVKAIGLQLTFWEIWILVAIQLPLQMLPLQGIANTGNHEGGWIAGLTLLGVSAEDALNFSILSHAILFLYVLTLGIPSIIHRKT